MAETVTVTLEREEAEHLFERCTESTNAPKINGYSCEDCRGIGERLRAALNASPQVSDEEVAAIERIWELLREMDCLPYAACVRDVAPGDGQLTDEQLAKLRVADKEADQQNRSFCRKLVEAATTFRISHVGPPPSDEEAGELEGAAEILLTALLGVLPVTGSWTAGYRVSESVPAEIRALPEEWATAAQHFCELHALLFENRVGLGAGTESRQNETGQRIATADAQSSHSAAGTASAESNAEIESQAVERFKERLGPFIDHVIERAKTYGSGAPGSGLLLREAEDDLAAAISSASKEGSG